VSGLDALGLTDDERRFLAMHARYEAEHQLDARGYRTRAVSDPTSGVILELDDERWATRHERRDRWQAIADALHPDGGRASAIMRASRDESVHPRDATGKLVPLPTTEDITVEDTCPSRKVDYDTGEILHCDGSRFCFGPIVDPMREHHNGAWTWSDLGAMPADRPCDHNCGQCVERTRDAVLDAAIDWRDQNDSHARLAALEIAIDEYRTVMGRLGR